MKFSYSSSMCVRTRCMHCKSEPAYFFYVSNKVVSKHLKTYFWKPDNIVSKFYSSYEPKFFRAASVFAFVMGLTLKVSPKYYQYQKDKFTAIKLPVQIAITCKCGKSVWYTPNEKKRNKADRYFDRNIKYLL